MKFIQIKETDYSKLAKPLESTVFVDLGFVALFYCSEQYDIRYSFFEDTLVLRLDYGDMFCYTVPQADNLQEIADSLFVGGKLVFEFVQEKDLQKFKEIKGYDITIKNLEKHDDYYSTYSDYIALDKKVAKRKYKDYNQFLNKYTHTVDELNSSNLHIAKELLEKWCDNKDCSLCSYGCEKNWILRLFDSWDKLQAKGLIVTCDGEVAGFCVAEQNADRVLKLVGKTIGNRVGVHVFMGIESVKRLFPDAKYVNMGPSGGMNGLIQFKSKFMPFTKLNKYYVELEKSNLT